MLFVLFVGSAMMIGSLAVSIMFFGAAARMLRWLESANPLGYGR